MSRRIRRPPRSHRAQPADRTPTNYDLLSRQIDEVELALRQEDPAFVRRFRRLQRRETVSVLTVFAFLASGAVLITVGLTMASVVTGSSGVIAMLAACLVEHLHQRALCRSSRERDDP